MTSAQLPTNCTSRPIPLAERSVARVCGRPLAGIAGLNPAGGMDVFILWVLCVVW